jgi:signal transduction histidine kinase/ActR/RegA family two-component response regulator
LSLAISILVSALIALYAFSLLRGMSDDLRRNQHFAEVLDKASALNILAVTLRSDISQRVLQQSAAANSSLQKLLQEEPARDSMTDILTEEMLKNSMDIALLLSRIQDQLSHIPAVDERVNMFATQLWIKSRLISDYASRLQELSHTRIVSAQELTGWAIIALVLGAALVNGAIFFASNRRIVRTEQNLRDLAGELEERVRERTVELENANRAKDAFLANMSHEIRTPVGEVIGMTDVLLQQDGAGPSREDLEIIRHSSGTILTLLNDLLDLSRIEQGKLELDIRTFSPKEMVSTLVRTFEMVALDKGIKFELIFGKDVPDRVKCDPDRIGQVLKNLLSNALKFTERGSVTLFVQLVKGTDHPDRLRFSVSDTGIGIPSEKQRQLFQPFTQLDPSYSKKFAGVGLGLAISKQLAELMGGEISVESESGKGSTFTMTLVIEKADEEARETPASMTLPDIPPLSILLAEDNAVNRLFLRRALITAGHKVDEAENGKFALTKLKETYFDLVLMDIQMPEMDGTEAMRLIRSGSHGRPDIPIIALTAYAMIGDREKFLNNGMDGYVTKPVDFGELARTIAAVCGILPYKNLDAPKIA